MIRISEDNLAMDVDLHFWIRQTRSEPIDGLTQAA